MMRNNPGWTDGLTALSSFFRHEHDNPNQQERKIGAWSEIPVEDHVVFVVVPSCSADTKTQKERLTKQLSCECAAACVGCCCVCIVGGGGGGGEVELFFLVPVLTLSGLCFFSLQRQNRKEKRKRDNSRAVWVQLKDQG